MKKINIVKILAISIPVILAALLLAGYLYAADFYQDHFFPNTTIGTVSCGNKTVAYAVEKNKKLAEDYVISVYDLNGNKYNINGQDFGYTYDFAPAGSGEDADYSGSQEAEILAQQKPYSWITEFRKEHLYELTTGRTFDETRLKEAVDALPIFAEGVAVAPQNAYVQMTKDGYEVVPEENGTMPKAEAVEAMVLSAVKEGAYSVTLTEDCYEKAEITSDDPSITELTAKIDTYLNATIHYTIEGEDENLTRQDIAGMLTIESDNSITINEDKVTDFVQKLATKYNTYSDTREFQTNAGDIIKIGGGDYGWIVSKSKEKEQILKDLEGGKPVERDVEWEQTAVQMGENDIGTTYIEIDYTKQHLWYYKDGVLTLDFDIVSGNISKQNGSVDGVYYIKTKRKDYTLVGEGYASPVNYFLPFAYNIGIHDADSWRKAYGGVIYKTSGSHGCVNAPLASVEKLYEMVTVGTPVVAYYRDEVKLTNYAAYKSNAYSYDGEY